MRRTAILVTLCGLLVLTPRGARAQRAAATAPVLGVGAHTYRWVPDWLKLPPGALLGPTHGDVVVDSRDRIFFTTDTVNALYTVDTNGRVLRVAGWRWGAGGHGLRLVQEPEPGRAGKGGRPATREVLWLAHLRRHEVLKLSLDGEILMTLPYPQAGGIYAEAKEYVPTAVDVAPTGDIYVVDGYGKGWLHQYAPDGALIRSWNGAGGPLGEAGTFKQPHGVGIDTRGPEPRVVVADRQNHRLQLFTLDGRFVREVHEELRLPSKVVCRGDDLLVVDLQGRVTLFDRDYRVLAQLGDNRDPELRGKFDINPEAWRAGEFISPHGAAWDSRGNLYVQDWNAFGRVSKLQRVRGKAAR